MIFLSCVFNYQCVLCLISCLGSRKNIQCLFSAVNRSLIIAKLACFYCCFNAGVTDWNGNYFLNNVL